MAEMTTWARDAEIIFEPGSTEEERGELMAQLFGQVLKHFEHPALHAIAVYDGGREVEVEVDEDRLLAVEPQAAWLAYRGRDLGYGVDEGSGWFVRGERDWTGKTAFRRAGGAETLCLFDDEIVEWAGD